MICSLCSKSVPVIIGKFCLSCVRAYGHQECHKRLMDKQKQENNNVPVGVESGH